MPKQIVLAFDLYGTLLDTSSIASSLKSHFAELEQDAANQAVQDWRKYQLEYTWRANSMGTYTSFSTITRLSLLHALHDAGKPLSEETITSLLTSYDSLSPFPDTLPALSTITSRAETNNIKTVVFSNGDSPMLVKSIENSLGAMKMPFVSVEKVQRYKPDPKTYGYLKEQVGAEGERWEVWLVSSNPFDVVGATKAGLKAVWVDRGGKGWADGMGKPTSVVGSMEEVWGVVSGE